ncbi:maltose ABC transporter permease MalF [Spongorhabdus nitratireducens]
MGDETCSQSAKSDQNGKSWLAIILVGLIDIVLLYGITLMYAQGEIAFALLTLFLMACGSWVFISQRGYCYRYVFPGLLGVFTFIVFPLLYTINIAFTNYGSNNLLSLERVREIHLAKTYSSGDGSWGFRLYQEGGGYHLVLEDNDGNQFETLSFGELFEPVSIQAAPLKPDSAGTTGTPLSMREIIKQRSSLKQLTIIMPDGTGLVLAGLRKFGPLSKIYEAQTDNPLILTDTRTGETLYPDMNSGFYTDGTNEVGPGFSVYTGWKNFNEIFSNPGIQGPFFKIFVWTVIFSALSVVFTLIIGLLLACLIQWEPLKGNGLYRMLLILPYAVPAFISILIFRGLFNQNFGEINMLLELLFGIAPEWFSDETLAKSMVLIVNTWLGYPYMMILAIGLLKAIPDDLYEASAIDGATPWQNLTRITIPLIIKPLTPLLIASFAFNFNNLVLIALLTGGGPDLLGATTPAGATDLLVSYTFRIAFESYGQDYGLASAIATLIFLIVGLIAWLNMRVTRRMQEG